VVPRYCESSVPAWPLVDIMLIFVARNPSCPRAIMQWQHGTYSKLSNGSLLLKPFGDGRQLMSDPCLHNNAAYTEYNQSQLIQVFEKLS
jgi:Chaperone for protein-folding within the ER, fungal